MVHIQLDPQQLRRAGAGQILIETGQALILDRIPDRRNRLAHAPDRFLERLRATLELIELLERRIDQHDRAFFRHRHQRSWNMPTLTQVHRNPAITFHVVLEQAPVFRVLLIEQYAILWASQTTRQLW
ncbi:hypothetical protein D3C85_1049130 [compost metagenome]